MTSKTPFEDQFGVLSIENQLRGKFYPVLTVQGTTEHSSDILHRLLTTDPQRRSVFSLNSRIARIIVKATGNVALTPSLPVDVLMKSVPANIATTDAL